jgi:WD40 repeat protein
MRIGTRKQFGITDSRKATLHAAAATVPAAGKCNIGPVALCAVHLSRDSPAMLLRSTPLSTAFLCLWFHLQVLSSSLDGTVRQWDIQEGTCLQTWTIGSPIESMVRGFTTQR